MYLLKTWFNNGSGAWIGILFIIAFLVAAVIRAIRSQQAGEVWYKDKRVYFFLLGALAVYLFFNFFIVAEYR